MDTFGNILIELFDSFTPLAATSKNTLLGNIEFVTYSKNDIIITEGKNNYNEYFLLDGIARRYNVSDKGETITTGFYYPKSVVTPHFARTIKSSSIFSLQALTDSVFAQLPVRVFDHLRLTYSDVRLFGQTVVERELSKSILDETVFRSYTAKQRLIQMRSAYPNLENFVPHNIIASFLGVTPVSFSRLRNDLASAK